MLPRVLSFWSSYLQVSKLLFGNTWFLSRSNELNILFLQIVIHDLPWKGIIMHNLCFAGGGLDARSVPKIGRQCEFGDVLMVEGWMQGPRPKYREDVSLIPDGRAFIII